MIEIGNKRWRNLQEQVAWLTAMIGQATDIVKNVQGTVAAAADLPDASTFSNGTTYAVGSASPYEYYVAINGTWLDIGAFPQAGPAGADGVNGVSIFMTSFPTTSATTAIPVISVYNPDGRPVVHGLILSEQGDVFVVTAVNSIGTYDVTYRCSIKGPQGAQGPAGAAGAPGAQGPAGADGADGAPGADGATWKAGSAVIHVDGSGGAFVIPVSSYTGAKVGDFYLSTTTYTSDGFTINKGDVWTITAMTGDGTYGILSKVANIEGPQGAQGPAGADGAPGADGATWYSGTDVIHTGGSGGAYVIPLSSLPDLKVGDLYLVTSTYTSDGETLNNGDVWAVYSIADPYAVMTRRTNIEGPSGSGSVAWGQITGAIADQTDLQNALNAATELFWCTFNSTTFAQISNALANNKLPVLLHSGALYIYSGLNTDYYFVTYARYSSGMQLGSISCTSANAWFVNTSFAPESRSNKVTSISSSSTNTQYPSAKAVWGLAAPVIAPPSATAGQVWTADGNGGAGFQNAGGGVQKTLIWQKGTASYETLNLSLTDTYDYIEVIFSVDSSYSSSAIWHSEIYDTSLLDSYTSSIFYAFAFNGAYFKYRKVIISATSISIQPCYMRQLSNIGTEISSDPRSLQPYRIYGIKIS